ncbi:hypothetical protein [Paenibacillus harenae]|uniref:hypothetical protein n=1 Tax=Paenibacillus harenae TaxID=306543 RepID=UPI00278CF392|nr:hypothetical protein [Paenibacillus harenae]MDQ0063419.1 hypothetical protein [Paenibacillus harenae]
MEIPLEQRLEQLHHRLTALSANKELWQDNEIVELCRQVDQLIGEIHRNRNQ